eukprot:2441325-Pleurochrysis_carterae.AAC.1
MSAASEVRICLGIGAGRWGGRARQWTSSSHTVGATAAAPSLVAVTPSHSASMSTDGALLAFSTPRHLPLTCRFVCYAVHWMDTCHADQPDCKGA